MKSLFVSDEISEVIDASQFYKEEIDEHESNEIKNHFIVHLISKDNIIVGLLEKVCVSSKENKIDLSITTDKKNIPLFLSVLNKSGNQFRNIKIFLGNSEIADYKIFDMFSLYSIEQVPNKLDGCIITVSYNLSYT